MLILIPRGKFYLSENAAFNSCNGCSCNSSPRPVMIRERERIKCLFGIRGKFYPSVNMRFNFYGDGDCNCNSLSRLVVICICGIMIRGRDLFCAANIMEEK